MGLLNSEPRGQIKTTEELFAIAHAMEHEAATRYGQIAGQLRGHGNERLAAVFERLAAEERRHIESVVQWSQKEHGRVPDPALVKWELPETFDDEGSRTTDQRLLTAYRSLSMAVRNEERAFAFWTYVVAHADRADVRRAAEIMANEELEHVATLRRERRRAFHAERSEEQSRAAYDDPADLELRLADQLDALAATADEERAVRMRLFGSEARAIAGDLKRSALEFPRHSGTAAEPPHDVVGLSEFLVDRYLEAAENTADERAVLRAQAFAGGAVNRLAWVRSDLPEIARGRPL